MNELNNLRLCVPSSLFSLSSHENIISEDLSLPIIISSPKLHRAPPPSRFKQQRRDKHPTIEAYTAHDWLEKRSYKRKISYKHHRMVKLSFIPDQTSHRQHN